MKKIISCLLLATLLLASVIAMIPVSASEIQEKDVMISVGTKDTAANNHFAGEGNVFFYDYLKYVKEINTFPMPSKYYGSTGYVIRYGINGSGSASATDGTKTTSGFNHVPSSTIESIPYIPDDTYDQVFGYSFKNSVTVDGIKVYLPTNTSITSFDVYGASADVENGIYAKEAEKILLASFSDVNLTEPQSVTEADGVTTANVIVIEETEFTEALKIDYIIFGVTTTNKDAYKIYEIELNGVEAGYADFTALKAQIAAYKEVAPYYANYTSASWTALEEAFTKANAINKNASSTQEEITTAASEIETAISNLEIDKTALNDAIAQAQTKVEADYTPSTWSAFATMLDTALAAQENEAIAPDAIAEIAQSLMDVMNALVERANFTAIDNKLAKVEALNQADYSEASWSALQAVIAKVPTAKANAELTQEEADALLGELTTAISALKPPASFTALDEKLAEVASLNESDYIPASWDEFQTIVARAVAIKNASTTTQDDIDGILQELTDGMTSILCKKADKTTLQAEVTAAQDLKKENYDVQDVTWNVFIKSIDDAKEVLDNPNATQAEVDAALAELKANIKNLGKAYDDFDPSKKPDNDTNKDTEADDETEATENEETNNVTESNTETQAPAQTQAPATESKRCGSAVATTSVIVTIVAALGSAVVIKKKD